MADLGDTSYQDAKALRWAYNMMYLRWVFLTTAGLSWLLLKIVGVL